MSDSRNNRRHLTAILATVLFHAMVVAILVFVYLRYPGSEDNDRTWPPVDSSEVLFGGEYVMIGDSPQSADNSSEPAPDRSDAESAPSPEAEALENSGEPAEPAPVITSKQPSPAKTEAKPKPEKTGPSKEEREAAEKARREQEQRQAINNKVKFGKNGTGGQGSGTPGQPDGNSTFGAVNGSPGYNLKGRTLAQWHKPPKGPLGSITIRVSVNRQGKVTSATYLSGTGAAAASLETRRNCERAALQSQFSVDMDAAAAQTGTITYSFD